MKQAARVSLLWLVFSSVLLAQPTDADVRERIGRGVAYLLRTQREDGSWSDRVGRKVHYKYVGRIAPHVGVTALAGMSLLASCMPDVENAPRARLEAVRKAAEYLASQTRPDGFITAHGSRMYSHALATVFLSRLCRADPTSTYSRVRRSLQRAVTFSIDTQNAAGGWRYLPGATDSDLSVTACQLVAVTEARRAGMDVPETTLTQASLYVRACLVEAGPGSGAFFYQTRTPWTPGPSRTSFSLAACGLAALAAAGFEELPAFRGRCLDYLARNRPQRQTATQNFTYYYGSYGAARAALRAGESGRSLYGAIREDVLALQESDGRWTDWVGPNYATAVATLILLAPRLARLEDEDPEE